jgi:hypothetical protein
MKNFCNNNGVIEIFAIIATSRIEDNERERERERERESAFV